MSFPDHSMAGDPPESDRSGAPDAENGESSFVFRTRQKIQMEMVDQLCRCLTLGTEAARQLLVEITNSALRRQLPLRADLPPRMQFVALVHSCAGVPGGLRELITSVTHLEQESWESVRLQLLLDEWYAAGLVPHPDWDVFRTLLGDLVRDDLADLFDQATRYQLRRPPHRTTAWHYFVYLTSVNAGSDGLPPNMVFLDLIAHLLPDDEGQRVRLHNMRRAGALGLTTALNAARWRPAAGGPGEAQSAYLIIQLTPDGVDDDSYVMSHWQQWDVGVWRPERGEDRVVHRSALETEVERLVAAAEERGIRGPGIMTIEFILPWELLNAPVDWWLKESQSAHPTPLTMDYPVVVRSLERMRTPRWHRPWHARWRTLMNESLTAHTYHSTPADGDYFIRLETDLKADDRIVAIVLSSPPEPGTSGRHEAEAALRSGLPVIIWHRNDCTSSSFRSSVDQLLQESALARLPERTRELRRQALRLDPERRDSHVGRHLTVLWDDPERQPEVSRSSGAS